MFTVFRRRELDGTYRFAHEECAWTHYNGERPFKVVIQNHTVHVYEHDSLAWSTKHARRVFVGESPADHPATVYSENCKGNSVLIEIASRDYMFVGHGLFRFSTIDHIRDNGDDDWHNHGFVSPVGNFDVPYPYAVDEGGRYYLLTENVRLDAVPDKVKDDPYGWYYQRRRITRVVAGHIKRFYLGDDEYHCYYYPECDYDRLVAALGPMSVQYRGQTQPVQLNKLDYSEWMSTFGNKAHFYPLRLRRWNTV